MASLISALVALIGAAILYNQWRTAHQRAVFDLFDLRMSVVSDLENAIGEVYRTTDVDLGTLRQVGLAQARARFLFGADIHSRIQALRDDFAWRSAFNDHAIDADADRQRLLQEKRERVSRIVHFGEHLGEIFAPYMRMSQTVPLAIDWWRGAWRLWAVLSVGWIVYCIWRNDPRCILCSLRYSSAWSYHDELWTAMIGVPLLAAILIPAVFWVTRGFSGGKGSI